MDRPTEEQLNIRKMSKDDVPAVFDIERSSFNDSSWSIDAFYHEIEKNEFANYFVIESVSYTHLTLPTNREV